MIGQEVLSGNDGEIGIQAHVHQVGHSETSDRRHHFLNQNPSCRSTLVVRSPCARMEFEP
jgi:hypothetical protein